MFDDDFAPIACSLVPFSTVWLDPEQNIFCIVDTIDLAFAQQWLWGAVSCKSGPKRIVKWYARRSGTVGGKSVNVWLHKEILLRHRGPPPSKSATIGDHQNGNSLDCRRRNLEWSTSSANRLNLYGSVTHKLRLGFKKVEGRHHLPGEVTYAPPQNELAV